MLAIKAAKMIIGTTASLGTGAIIGNLVKATTPADLRLMPKIFIGTGTTVLGMMVGDMVSKYVEEQIDTIVDSAAEGGKAFKAAKAKAESIVVEENK